MRLRTFVMSSFAVKDDDIYATLLRLFKLKIICTEINLLYALPPRSDLNVSL